MIARSTIECTGVHAIQFLPGVFKNAALGKAPADVEAARLWGVGGGRGGVDAACPFTGDAVGAKPHSGSGSPMSLVVREKRSLRSALFQRNKSPQLAASFLLSQACIAVYWPAASLSAAQRFGRYWVRSGHWANTANRSLLTRCGHWIANSAAHI
jgi:hypothetical protein